MRNEAMIVAGIQYASYLLYILYIKCLQHTKNSFSPTYLQESIVHPDSSSPTSPHAHVGRSLHMKKTEDSYLNLLPNSFPSLD